MKLSIIRNADYMQLDKVVKLAPLFLAFAITGCGDGGTDLIKSGVTQKGSVSGLPDANLITYTSGKIALDTAKSGSSQQRIIKFTVKNNDVVLPNKQVEVELTRSPSDFSFVTDGNRDKRTLITDVSGVITIPVYAGVLPGPVEIKATLLDNRNLIAYSKGLSVSTGLPDQIGMTSGFDGKMALNRNVNGDSTNINIRLVDRLGNPVSDGTTVNFIAEGGKIQPSCSTSGGTCSAELSVQNPKPFNGRVTVLAWLEGDKSYKDVNGDNLYTIGTDNLINNIGDFFRDDNENNLYDEGEFIMRRGASGADCKESNIYEPNIQDTCDFNLGAVLRRQLIVTFSDNRPTLIPSSLKRTGETGVIAFQMFGNSNLTAPMPSGTTLTMEVEDEEEKTAQSTTGGSGSSTNGGNSGNTSEEEKDSCEAKILQTGNSPVPELFNPGTPQSFKDSNVVKYLIEHKNCTSQDKFALVITAPDGTATRYNIG